MFKHTTSFSTLSTVALLTLALQTSGCAPLAVGAAGGAAGRCRIFGRAE